LQAMELTLLVERLSRRRPVHRLLATLARPPRLCHRVRPRTVELHDSGAVREAAAGERDQLRLLLAPPRQGVRPLASAARLERLFAGSDHAAVDDAGEHR